MAGRKLSLVGGAVAALLNAPFRAPYIASNIYRTGRQPFAPGESQLDSGGPAFGPIPWPNTVPSLLALASFPGLPRDPALGIVNNSTSDTPNNNLFLSGFSGKSRG